MVSSGYPMDNAHTHSASHHSALSDLLDPFTTARLHHLGDGTWAGATCLEVGAGDGSIAWWLADQVGPAGRVVATDIDPRRVPAHPRLTALRHDLSTEPVPDGPFDLIHARLVLGHLPRREAILARLAAALAPGGTLVVEDWAALRAAHEILVSAPTEQAGDLYASYQHNVGGVFDRAGTDRNWARRIHVEMLALGLADVATEVHAQYWTGGSAGCRFVGAVLEQVRPRLWDTMADDELDEVLALLEDPRLVVHGHPLYSTSGRRPTAA